MTEKSLYRTFSDIKFLILDFDGVFTKGSIFFSFSGEEQEYINFDIQDGQGIRLLIDAGIRIAVISGRNSDVIVNRCRCLGIDDILIGISDKSAALDLLLEPHNISVREVAYIGDDISDIPIMRRVGLPIAVPNAVKEVKNIASLITRRNGGDGAIREICDILLRTQGHGIKSIGVIPARFASTRFPGKPLCEIDGIPMIVHVYRQAIKSDLDEVIVATEDDRIRSVCENNDIRVEMTSSFHRSGTDRVAEIAKKVEADIFINIQGDEPLIPPELINSVLREIVTNPQADIVTAVCKIDNSNDINDPNVVKVVVSFDDRAIYFTRSPIPYQRKFTSKIYSHRHIGIYGYHTYSLIYFAELPYCVLEEVESLEQLRALFYNMNIQVIHFNYRGLSVDTPSDLVKLKKYIKEKSII